MTAIAAAGNGSLVDYIGFSDFADDLQADRLPASGALYCLVLDLHRLDDLFQTCRGACYRYLVTHRYRGLQLYYGYGYLREEVGDPPDLPLRFHHGFGIRLRLLYLRLELAATRLAGFRVYHVSHEGPRAVRAVHHGLGAPRMVPCTTGALEVGLRLWSIHHRLDLF